MNDVYMGVAYYPEDWDVSEIVSDIEKMHSIGINTVRIGEFAWKKDEPFEGEYNFEWLHYVIDKMTAAGIYVVLGTPTATPPFWLTQKYPDMLVEREDGSHASHGGRRHCCSSNPNYIEYSRRIVEQLGREFGDNPNVIGWQIDNEIYSRGLGCCCDYCLSNFHKHLKEKFGTIEELNKAWNLNLFSQAYESFEEIPVPRNTWHNPHIKMEWYITQHKSEIDFVHMQAEILHKYTKAPVGTDVMAVNGTDMRQYFEKMDVVQLNHYEGAKGICRDAMWMDYIREYSKVPFWITETQACWNGSASPLQSVHPDGFIYMNSVLPFVLGGQANMYWLWRTHWAGHELMHGAVIDSFGRPTYTHNEIRRACRDVKKIKDFLCNTKVESNVAIHHTSLSWNMQMSQQIHPELDEPHTVSNYIYKPLIFSGIHPDIVDLYSDLDKYKLVFSPNVYTLEEADFHSRIKKWVNDGGCWVVGPLTDIRTSEGSRYKESPYGIIEELTGARLEYFIPDMEGVVSCVAEADKEVFEANNCYEVFADDSNAEVIARISSGHKEIINKPCVLSYKVGKGSVIILGTFPGMKEMKNIIRIAVEYAGIVSEKVEGDSLIITKRKGSEYNGTFVLDLCGKGGIYSFDGEKTDALTGKKYKDSIKASPYEMFLLV